VAKVEIYLSCNDTVLEQPAVAAGVRDGAKEVEHDAEVILETVRATTNWDKISGPDGLTYITSEKATDQPVDWFVSLWAPNPVAIEYGHQPSGWFAGTDTKAPDGLYILHQAAGLA
jgi:hypothetical protein